MNNWRDWQSVAYLLALPTLVAWSWGNAAVSVPAYIMMLMLVIGVCCISHNHAHLPIWRWSWLNHLTDMWIGVLQGQPVFLFQPAHIESHHRYNQGPEDVTRVLRYAANNNVVEYLIFPFQVLSPLGELRKRFLAGEWQYNRKHFWWIVTLYVPVVALWLTALVLNPYKAIIYIFIPQVVGLHFLLASNYLQHAHAVPGSRYNHSRNFVGFINRIWFNVGYHTAHHEDATLHWTLLPAAHKEIAPQINPRLIERSLFIYVVNILCFGLIFRSLRSKPLSE